MAKDPYKYFRIETHELLEGLTQGVLQLEKGTGAPDLVARLLRLGHTLKGAARVVKQPAMAELAHTVEGLLASDREHGQPMSPRDASELLGLLDQIGARVRVLDAATDDAAPPQPSAVEPPETLRVEIHEMDALLRGVTEAGVHLGALRKSLAAASGVRDLAGLLADVDRVEGELSEIRETTHRFRLIPAHTIFPALDRAVRDAAQALGKRAELETTGGEIRLDASVLASLRDPLTHVVRNAVAHGVEPEAERRAAGKPSVGRVRLVIERRGGRVAFTCRDDGRGIDIEAVRHAAIAVGRVPASEGASLSSEQVMALLTVGGLTTSRDVTELSGRGIGLDIVREATVRLKGQMSIRSETGRGATVEIQVPVSVASLQGLIVEAGGAVAAIPLDCVRRTLRVSHADVAHSVENDSIVDDGHLVPFVMLDHILRRSGPPSRGSRSWSTVIVQDGDRRVAIAVDRLLGTSSIVMHALPAFVGADPVVSGASLDAEGNPLVVLDPVGLTAAAEHSRGRGAGVLEPARAPILVIDDSLTTRMLEQSILESAGYEVEVAMSAEEALTKAHARRYSLFIVDVEMPGMDGFEFVALTRSDVALRDIPAILVTSRDGAEDRRRGERAGARAYIVKSEFDQRRLLHTIQTLIA